ncbi:MAG: hypothetical protein ACK412_06920 [Chloroherpetonaceae bacterium]
MKRLTTLCSVIFFITLGAFANDSFSGTQRALLYLAWSGLRPMTELEFEKACRGVEKGVPGEFAWGNASAVAATSINGNEDGTETITNAQANVNYNNVTHKQVPLTTASWI